MARPTEVNLTEKLFFGFDVAGSSLMGTDQLLAMRARIFPGISRVVRSMGLRERNYQLREAGDGGVVVIDRKIDEGVLLTEVLPKMAAHIHDDGSGVLHKPLRLRYVLHNGDVWRDAHGYFGGELPTTFRMLDSENLRKYLESTNEAGVVVVSPSFMEAAVSPGSSLNTPQQRLLYDWDDFGMRNKELEMRGHAALLSGAVRLAGAAALQCQPTPTVSLYG